LDRNEPRGSIEFLQKTKRFDHASAKRCSAHAILKPQTRLQF
jgi:hypothetical protein